MTQRAHATQAELARELGIDLMTMADLLKEDVKHDNCPGHEVTDREPD